MRRIDNQNGSAVLIVLFIVVLGLIGGAGAYVATDGFGRNKPAPTAASKDTTSPLATSAASATITDKDAVLNLFKAALNNEGSIKCTATGLNDDHNGTATIYVKDSSHYRVDSVSNGQASHLMVVGGKVYSWIDGKTQGAVLSFDDSQQENLDVKYKDEYANNPNLKVSCQKTAVGDSLFAVPAGVSFADPTANLQGSGQ